jgi:hypothetical protein
MRTGKERERKGVFFKFHIILNSKKKLKPEGTPLLRENSEQRGGGE